MNVYIPQSQTDALAHHYRSGDEAVMEQELRPATIRDELREHGFKFVHIAIVIGITWLLLARHKQGEPELMIFSA
jgi:uncharacterized protein with GYD domain